MMDMLTEFPDTCAEKHHLPAMTIAGFKKTIQKLGPPPHNFDRMVICHKTLTNEIEVRTPSRKDKRHRRHIAQLDGVGLRCEDTRPSKCGQQDARGSRDIFGIASVDNGVR